MSNETLQVQTSIETLILTIREQQVLADIDLARLYQVENRALKQAVRRNLDKFPDDFMFRLTKEESKCLILNRVSQNVIPEGYNLGASDMFAFTEQGVAMLATVLKSEVANQVSICIMRAFVAMRRFISVNAALFQRIENVELKQIATDRKIDDILSHLGDGSLKPIEGIFFEGQIFDAYKFVEQLVQQAKQSVVLIDNYVDASVIDLLGQRPIATSADIYAECVSAAVSRAATLFNAQHPDKQVALHTCSSRFHDRFLIIDDDVYHLGASIKDLGRRLFAFSKMGMDKSVVLERV